MGGSLQALLPEVNTDPGGGTLSFRCCCWIPFPRATPADMSTSPLWVSNPSRSWVRRGVVINLHNGRLTTGIITWSPPSITWFTGHMHIQVPPPPPPPRTTPGTRAPPPLWAANLRGNWVGRESLGTVLINLQNGRSLRALLPQHHTTWTSEGACGGYRRRCKIDWDPPPSGHPWDMSTSPCGSQIQERIKSVQVAGRCRRKPP